MHFDDYHRYDALGLADLVRRGEVHPSELLDTALARADVTGSLNAIVMRLDESARARAQAPFDKTAPFAGVPFLVKDLFQDMQGLPTSAGCRTLKAAAVPAPQDSDVVRRWREAGLVIFGKTNTPEFGAKNVTESEAWGPARNPWDPTRTPGGSSGGSSAAVAASVVPVAGANDGGGSIRIPAAACGLFGFKAGRGRISMGPMMGEALNGAAVQGVVSHSVRDSAAMLDVLQGPEPHAPYHMPAPEVPYLQCLQRPPGRLRIGFSTVSPIGTPVDPHALAAVAKAAALLTDLGHHVEPCGTPFNGVQLAEDFLLAWFCAQAFIIDHIHHTLGIQPKHVEADTRFMAAIGRHTSALRLLQCEARWHEHNLALSGFHARYDLWLSPTLAAPPPRLGSLATPPALALVSDVVARLGLAGWLGNTPQFKQTVLQNLGWTPYTQLANLTGRPAMSVPLYRTPEGLPLGVQFVAGLNGEALLLQLAAQLEQAQPWRHPPPRPMS
ncbi:MAG: amidase [Aquabacterium sp.]|jgi:amidase|uniref:amidase n=1 Tax=Aquabacterium sp. TaxID=1872578 RepID=UPI001B503C35|nr:amidase family protein [Aquabacterium sp.]MBP7132847.1 amidase [Aquabacterium sp.]